MTKLEAAARQAITVLSQCLEHPEADDAIAGLREALAEQAAEPVEWPHKWGCRANAFGECNMGCTVQQPSHQAAEPNAVLVEGFGRVAMRKLNDLHENGYAINGVSIATISEAGETQLGAVTTGGRVLWWPQQPAQQAAEPVDKVAIMQRIVDSQTGHTRTVAREPEHEPTCKQHLQVWVIPKGKGRGQFSWEPQDERFWTRMEPAVKQSLTVHPTQQPLTAERVIECAARLVAHADFQLGGVLGAQSKPKDIPSNAVSKVKARHLAALRDALAARDITGSKEGGAA